MFKPKVLVWSSLCDDVMGIGWRDVDVEGVAGDGEPVFVVFVESSSNFLRFCEREFGGVDFFSVWLMLVCFSHKGVRSLVFTFWSARQLEEGCFLALDICECNQKRTQKKALDPNL